MNDKKKQKRPTFKGLAWHREQYFSFFIPTDWHKVDWQDERQGILYIPDREDAHTLFAVEVKDLGTTLSPDDLPYLSKGFFDAVKALPERKIESKNERVHRGFAPTRSQIQLSRRWSDAEAMGEGSVSWNTPDNSHRTGGDNREI